MSDPTGGVETVPSNAEPTTTTATPEGKTYDLMQPIFTVPSLPHLKGTIAVRHHRHSDAETMSRHANNPKIAANMSNRWPVPYSVDRCHDWIAKCRDESSWRAIGPTDPESNDTAGSGQKLPTKWVITLDDEVIGGCGLDFQDDVFVRALPFGYWLSEEYWGKGIMSAVLRALVAWVWETYPWIIKLGPSAYDINPGSQRVLEKAGFALEGRMKCAVMKNGAILDVLVFGLVRDGIVSTGKAPVKKVNGSAASQGE